VLAVGIAAIKFLPGLLSQAEDLGNAKTSAPANASANRGGGPLGEVNEAMDVSDALDSGGSRSRPAAARPKALVPGKPATNSVAKPSSPSGGR